MTDNDRVCDKGDCTRLSTYALRTDRLSTTFEVCGGHVIWAIKFFMKMHGRKVEPFVISEIAFRREASEAVPAIKAELLDEAADRIQGEITVQTRSEGKSRAVALLREMGHEARS
ncbi:hypothetical protein ACFFS2_30710 [Streptomyces aurantiacus]|uniref:Uncharacterized protein n=1 Tax=Streptomyces aurantiacus TaxID=47760 RepID=A0A7G1P0M3_9ACTN|nr:hypothetical protein [Streptomyces aurantiacus]BCL28522.1 hypothetical protein GCM10017557_33810 [Streptomyces aurantiacus]